MKFFNWPLLGIVIYAVFVVSLGFYYQRFLTTSQTMSLEAVEFETDPQRLKITGQGLNTRLSAYLTPDPINHSALMNNILTDGYVAGVQIAGGKLFVGNLRSASEVFSLEDPLYPQKLKVLSGMVGVWHVDVDDKSVVYTTVQRRIYVYDQQDLTRRGYVLTKGEPMASLRRGHYLYSAESRAGLSIYDFSNSEKLSLISQLALDGKASALAFSGDFLLVAAQGAGLHLIDIRDPHHPRLVKTLPAKRSYETVAVHQGIIYASDSFLQLDVLKLEANGEVRRISTIPLLGNVRDMAFGSQRLYLAESQNGVRSVDISDPSTPRSLGSILIPGDPRGLALSGNYLYVAAANAGVQIVDIRHIRPRRFLSMVNTPGIASHAVAAGSWLYVADGYAGLAVLDLSRLPKLTQVAQLPTGSDLIRLAQAKNYLYGITSGRHLLVFDISQPQTPRLVYEESMTSGLNRLIVCGDSLLIGDRTRQLFRLDISIPDKPRLMETLSLPDSVRQLAVGGNRVFIADGRAGLLISRVEKGQPLQLTAAVERSWPMSEFVLALGVAVRGDFAFVSLGKNGLQVLNISDADEVRELLLLPIDGFVREIQLSEKFAVLADFENGYTFVNIQQPQRPFLAAQMPAAFRQLAGFIVDKEQIYQPSRGSGVQILPLPLALTQTRAGSGDVAEFHLNKRPEPGWYSLNLSDRRQFVSRPAAVELQEF